MGVLLTLRSPEMLAPARMPVAEGKKMENIPKKLPSAPRQSGTKFWTKMSAGKPRPASRLPGRLGPSPGAGRAAALPAAPGCGVRGSMLPGRTEWATWAGRMSLSPWAGARTCTYPGS